MNILCEFEVNGNRYERIEVALSAEIEFVRHKLSRASFRYFNCKHEFNIAGVHKRYFEIKHIKANSFIVSGVDDKITNSKKRKLYWTERNQLKCKIANYELELSTRKQEYIRALQKYEEERISCIKKVELYKQFMQIKNELEK